MANSPHISGTIARRILAIESRKAFWVRKGIAISRRRYSRPTFAPKPVLDIKHIRLNPGLYEQNCISRNYESQSRNSWHILSLHHEWTQLQTSSRSLREQNNAVRRQLASFASSPEPSADQTRDERIAQAKEHQIHLVTRIAQEKRASEESISGLRKKEQSIRAGLASTESDLATSSSEYTKAIREIHTSIEEALAVSSRRLETMERQLAESQASLEPSEGQSRSDLLAQAKDFKTQLEAIGTRESEIEAQIESLAAVLPNLSSQHTPSGSEPTVLAYLNDHPEPEAATSDRVWRSHVHVGSELGLLDFSAASTTSGWGWYFLLDEATTLEHALIQYALSIARKYGWRTVTPPSIVYSHIASACGFQPRDQNGETQIYALAQPEKDIEKEKPGLVLAGTAEIPIAAMKANTTLEAPDLPLKLIGASRCYRAEAGARGVDTKGLYRVHEFTKVEMFAWTSPDDTLPSSEKGVHFSSSDESGPGQTQTPQEKLFDEMLSIQKEIISGLGLHARVLEMPATDLGASAQRKIDIEAFFPSRRERDQGWGEVSSLSKCGDYQTRRLGTKVRRHQGSKKVEFPFTLNGTALAVPRVLAAIMEMGWDEEERRLSVPEVLWPWMGGVKVIERKK